MRPLWLPPGMRCSAYWYAQAAGLLTGNGDLDFLRELGWHAAVLAGWHQIPPWKVNEGPYWVHTWPEWVWSATADLLAHTAAEYGDDCPDPASHPDRAVHPHGYREAGDYGEYDVIPPWCPLPRGEQALRDIGY